MLRVLELFAGIGACSKALERLGIEHEIVDAVEIDKYAIASFNAVHGTNFEPQDITKWDKDLQVDLIMHGSPCQDFSVAGKGAGGDEGSGTRSSLLYETLRIVEKLRPKYVIWENVKNLLSKKHVHNWNAYAKRMEEMGYTNYCQVLNAKDYGVPQNRERVFTVSIRETILKATFLPSGKTIDRPEKFEFPAPIPLARKLKDMLEPVVDEKYYLSEDRLNVIYKWEQRQKENGRGFRFEVKDGDDIGRAVTTSGDRPCSTNYIIDPQGRKNKRCFAKTLSPTLRVQTHGNPPQVVEKIAIKTANKQGYDLATDGDGIDLTYPDSTTRRGRVGHGVSKTIPSVCGTQGVVDGYRIRKLTPKECWRLMGFDDADFDKAAKVNSNTQLYKQAGNSIVVNVLEAILGRLLDGSRD